MSGVRSRGRRSLLLALLAMAHLAAGDEASAHLKGHQAVFTGFLGPCGVVDAEAMGLVSFFPCEAESLGVDVTSDGALAVVGSLESLSLIDLAETPAREIALIPSMTRGTEELDIAPNDLFGVATGSLSGFVSRFSLEPFQVTGRNLFGDELRFAIAQDVHIDVTSTLAILPSYRPGHTGLLLADVTGPRPEWLPRIPTRPFNHHGISLNEGDNDTILAGVPSNVGRRVTVASLSTSSVTAVLRVSGRPQSIDITCDGTRAVVETREGLDWIDTSVFPPILLHHAFGPSRPAHGTNSAVAFTADGSTLFVGGRTSQTQRVLDVYDARTDPPTLLEGSPIPVQAFNVATLPCGSTTEVSIDIKPESASNPINLKRRGVVSVAILGSTFLDVVAVDTSSLAFGNARPVHRVGGHVEDTNEDGLDDLVSHYGISSIGLGALDETICVTGMLLNGAKIEGCDTVSTR